MLWIAILNYQQKVDKISGWPYKNHGNAANLLI